LPDYTARAILKRIVVFSRHLRLRIRLGGIAERLRDKDNRLMTEFEVEYQDVLQNIEFAIVSVYREHSELLDYEVERALNALIVAYQAEQQHRVSRPTALSPLAQQVFTRVNAMCEWRLGREAFTAEEPGAEIPHPSPVSLEEIVACLKRTRKSVKTWTQEGGRQGYLRFVSKFIV